VSFTGAFERQGEHVLLVKGNVSATLFCNGMSPELADIVAKLFLHQKFSGP
jgi:hypothetical protein